MYQGATVVLTAANLPAGRTAVTDADGRFEFVGLTAGTFRLTVQAQGFASQAVQGILHEGESLGMQPVVLLMTATASEVQVTAYTPEMAQELVIEEEKQRVFGVFPNFYVAYAPDAPALTTRQKYDLAWKSSVDPVSFAATGVIAGIQQAENNFKGYGQGAQGYAKRFGANFADDMVSNMVGNAILPSLLKQDPRYFYKGTGTVKARTLYALAMAVMCRGDNGRWQVNYSGLAGGIASGGISNLYYPASSRQGAALTFETAGYATIGTAVQNLMQEFVVKHFTPKLPHYGAAKAARGSGAPE